MQAFQKYPPQMNGIFNSEGSSFEKISGFADSYTSFVIENPYLPTFPIYEINSNQDFTESFFNANSGPNPVLLENQIAKRWKKVPYNQRMLDNFYLIFFWL